MMYLLKSYFFFFKKKRRFKIAFIASSYHFYNRVMPSTRIRVYDIIDAFKNNSNYLLSIYNKLNKFDVVIFQKLFDEKNYQKALELKKKGTEIVLDINVNYYDKSSDKISQKQHDSILKFTEICDALIVSSIYLQVYIQKLFPNKKIVLIQENINYRYFEKVKKIKLKEFTFIWSGYSAKALELLMIKDILLKIFQKLNFKIVIISNKNPYLKIGNIPIKYIKYNERTIIDNLLQGDVFIAPRNLKDGYNKGHSFTKIGVAMALGMPVVASPVVSYLDSPAIICKNKAEWFTELNNILTHKTDLKEKSKEGIKYCKQNYDILVIKKQYEELFNNLLN